MILGIDPSLSNTAIIRGDATSFVPACYGSEPRGDATASRVARYRHLVARIGEWVGDARPDAIFIEGYSFGSNMARAQFSAEYGGLLRCLLVDICDQVWEISPSTLKKFATGKGNAEKKVVVGRLEMRYKVRFKTHDEYDAFALYRIGLMVRGEAEPADLAQSEVLHQLQNRTGAKAKAQHGSRTRRPPEKTLF